MPILSSGRRLTFLAILLPIVFACRGPSETELDAWALWLEYEPDCASILDRNPSELSPRWRRAVTALATETLAAMEERLTAGERGSGPTGERLRDLLAASRALCSLSAAEPSLAGTSTLARAQAEVAAARAWLAVEVPLNEAERVARVGRFTARLSAAVSDSLEESLGGRPSPSDGPERVAGAHSPGRATEDELQIADGPTATDRAPAPQDQEPLQRPPSGGPKISIRAVSGESWAELRRRRSAEAKRRRAAWEPHYRRGLEAVDRLRNELARTLADESLEDSWRLCVRLGRAAGSAPAELVSRAPDRFLARELAAAMAAYAAAGRACDRGEEVQAWERLTAGDRHRAEVSRRVAQLADQPLIPESLRRRTYPPARKKAASRGVE